VVCEHCELLKVVMHEEEGEKQADDDSMWHFAVWMFLGCLALMFGFSHRTCEISSSPNLKCWSCNITCHFKSFEASSTWMLRQVQILSFVVFDWQKYINLNLPKTWLQTIICMYNSRRISIGFWCLEDLKDNVK
jgi:hypothetical protein